jgi:hypothetical protein
MSTALLIKGVGLLVAPLLGWAAYKLMMGDYKSKKPPPLRNKD